MAGLLSDYGKHLLTVLQIVIILTSFKNESDSRSATQYSKFAKTADKTSTVPTRYGMLIIYVPALVLSAVVYAFKLSRAPTVALCAIHFGKRTAETLFLHKYSGLIPIGISVGIGLSYSLMALMFCFMANPYPSKASLNSGLCK